MIYIYMIYIYIYMIYDIYIWYIYIYMIYIYDIYIYIYTYIYIYIYMIYDIYIYILYIYIYIIDSCPPIAKHSPKTDNLGSKTSWIFVVFLILFCCFARPFGNKKHQKTFDMWNQSTNFSRSSRNKTAFFWHRYVGSKFWRVYNSIIYIYVSSGYLT